ncbi:MAG: hypothetical protein ACKVOW_01245, partial [Chitinophagaceae bacterium]
MRRIIITCFTLGLLLWACNSTDTKYSSLISINNLPSQKFKINSLRDTFLVTAKGAILNISKGTLVADAETVELEIKEAYNMEDIFRAG